MRIVGGEARGRRLFAPDGEGTRPTADRVRESLFNILSRRVVNANVLDLFSGSGALALEAISRGARAATMVERDRNAQQVIARNIELMRCQDRATLIPSDWRVAVKRLHEPYDIAFLDPPYALTEVYGEAATMLRTLRLLTDGAVLIMEHRTNTPLTLPPEFEIYDERKYGEASIAFVREAEK